MSNTIQTPHYLAQQAAWKMKRILPGDDLTPIIDSMHAHAAAVSAAKDKEIAGLREYLDAAQRRGEELRAQVAALTENGPPMQRGTTIEGTPWMGTMREVLEDYKSAADTEARWGDEARAEVAGLRKALAAAIRQNEHDMLMTGEELRAARAALGDKT